MSRSVPRIGGVLGRGARERFIASLALNERAHLSALARSIGAPIVTVARVVRFFEERGLVQVDRRSSRRTWIALSHGPMHDALVAFGRRVAAVERIARLPHRPRSRPMGRARQPDVGDLFVSRTATRILLHVDASAESDAAELHRLLGIDEAVVRATVARLVKDRLLRRGRRDWKRVPVRLDGRHPAAAEIFGLLRAVARLRPESRALAAAASRRRRVTPRTPKAGFPRTGLPRAAALLPLFHPAQARVLAALASCGPLTGVALAHRIGVAPGAARGVANTLVAAGMARAVPTRSSTVVHYALDPSHPLAPELWALLAAACRAARLRVAPAPTPSPSCSKRAGWPPDHRGLAALSLAVFDAGATDLGALAKATRAKRSQVADRLRILRDAKWVVVDSRTPTTRARMGEPPLRAEIAALLDAMRAAGLSPSRLRVMGDVSG